MSDKRTNCTKCGPNQPAVVDRSELNPSGQYLKCRYCHKVSEAARRASNPEPYRAAVRRYKLKHRGCFRDGRIAQHVCTEASRRRNA